MPLAPVSLLNSLGRSESALKMLHWRVVRVGGTLSAAFLAVARLCSSFLSASYSRPSTLRASCLPPRLVITISSMAGHLAKMSPVTPPAENQLLHRRFPMARVYCRPRRCAFPQFNFPDIPAEHAGAVSGSGHGSRIGRAMGPVAAADALHG